MIPVPAEIAAERAAVLAEIGGSTLLTEFEQVATVHAQVPAHAWQGTDGSWRSLTYAQVRDNVRDAALGLAAAGFQPGETAVIWSGNRSETTVADYAVMHARGVPVILYHALAAEQAAYIARHAEATLAIVEDGDYLAKLLAIRDQLPRLRHVVVFDGTAPAGTRAWAEVLSAGRAEATRDPAQFEAMWRQVTADDLVSMIYTSGTTGEPKGVMTTHRNVRYAVAAVCRVVPAAQRSDPDGVLRVVSYLPAAHMAGRATDSWAPMALPTTVYYCRDPGRVFEAAAHARPTQFTGVPRIWEKLHSSVRAELAVRGLPDTTAAAVASLPRELRKAVLGPSGLSDCGLAVSGSAPLDPEIIAFFRALGLPLTEGWGMTELSNAATIDAPGSARPGTVGRLLPGMEARIAGDGEVLIRGPLVMAGYYKDPERTRETVGPDGWLHTGDIGEIDDDGYLTITDRKKELIITSGGRNVSPALVEYQLGRSPLIGQACAIGDNRNYVTALLVLDPEAVRTWAEGQGITAGDLAGAAADPRVLAEVERAVAEANSHLTRAEQVRRWKVLPAEWTVATGELTPTLKKLRRVITERYAGEIDQLYA